MKASTSWIVPCYNEESRIEFAAFQAFVDAEPEITLLFVNDGSRDQTEARLNDLARSRPSRIRVLSLPQNQGKGEAVRLGMLEALQGDVASAGYFDADLATPTSEIARLTRIIIAGDMDVVVGSRVAMLGRKIDRSPARHYLGRVFASAASVALSLPIYDTQCGAKLFRRTPALMTALSRPFHSRWLFDVELLGRLTVGLGGPASNHARMFEEPLSEWRDVQGSKVRARHFVGAVVDFAKITWDLHLLRRQQERHSGGSAPVSRHAHLRRAAAAGSPRSIVASLPTADLPGQHSTTTPAT